MSKYRTHTCGELNKKNKNQNIVLSGWINKKRDHGNLLFIDLRDHYGVTQCIIEKKHIDYIVKRIDRSYEKISQFISLLDKYSLKKGSPFSLKLIKEVLKMI